MQIDFKTFSDFFELGLHPIPLIWDIEKKQAKKHPLHDITDVQITPAYIQALLNDSYIDKKGISWNFSNANALALKVLPPLCFLDFDIKNSSNKNVYTEWLHIIESTNDEVLRKVCIEKTRSNGFHVYFKSNKIKEKISIARCNEKEVISIYTGGLLSYCYPTPGYELVHNDFNDIDFITDEELDLFISAAAFFNEDKEFTPGDHTVKLIEYPQEYEALCLEFDASITDTAYEWLLNSIDLFRVKKEQYKKQKYLAYLRKGSVAAYSAKVYFSTRKVMIFSASMPGYPNFHDSAHSGDTRWVLSPAKIVYYKNKRNWVAAIDEIKSIAQKFEFYTPEQKPVTNLPVQNRLNFPYDIFPEIVQQYIFNQVIQNEYLGAGVLAALSAAIGNSCALEAQDGYIVKCNLYLGIVAPPGAAKTPALKKAFQPIEVNDAALYDNYKQELDNYNSLLVKTKKDETPPVKPIFKQTLIKDSTIETVIKILSFNQNGCCILADELSGFLNRMNQYKAGDEVQKWLEIWSGSPVLVQRIGRDENKVQEPFCTIVGGIQPGVLDTLSKQENQFNGFYHRFLFCYPEPQEKINWQPLQIPASIKRGFFGLFEQLLFIRNNRHTYKLSVSANQLYQQWFDAKNKKYNRSFDDNTKGIIAKYQEYCLRFMLLLQSVYDLDVKQPEIQPENAERAIRLTEYFFGNMVKALQILSPDSPVDRLQKPYSTLYEKLPRNFTLKNTILLAEEIGVKEQSYRSFIRRNKDLFTQFERGTYEKNY